MDAGTLDHDAIHTEVLAALERAASATRDSRYRIALGIVRGRHGCGRPACDDTDALARMHALLESTDAKSIEQAARFVARTLSRKHTVASASQRLARKYRAAYVTS
jgi:hypothetical protein